MLIYMSVSNVKITTIGIDQPKSVVTGEPSNFLYSEIKNEKANENEVNTFQCNETFLV